MEQCTQCGSTELSGYDIDNPYSKLPMQRLLKVCGHLMWLTGVIATLALLWQTNNKDNSINLMFLFGGLATLSLSIIGSVCLFALGEMMRRVIRIQRKLRAFVDEYYTQTGNNSV